MDKLPPFTAHHHTSQTSSEAPLYQNMGSRTVSTIPAPFRGTQLQQMLQASGLPSSSPPSLRGRADHRESSSGTRGISPLRPDTPRKQAPPAHFAPKTSQEVRLSSASEALSAARASIKEAPPSLPEGIKFNFQEGLTDQAKISVTLEPTICGGQSSLTVHIRHYASESPDLMFENLEVALRHHIALSGKIGLFTPELLMNRCGLTLNKTATGIRPFYVLSFYQIDALYQQMSLMYEGKI